MSIVIYDGDDCVGFRAWMSDVFDTCLFQEMCVCVCFPHELLLLQAISVVPRLSSEVILFSWRSTVNLHRKLVIKVSDLWHGFRAFLGWVFPVISEMLHSSALKFSRNGWSSDPVSLCHWQDDFVWYLNFMGYPPNLIVDKIILTDFHHYLKPFGRTITIFKHIHFLNLERTFPSMLVDAHQFQAAMDSVQPCAAGCRSAISVFVDVEVSGITGKTGSS